MSNLYMKIVGFDEPSNSLLVSFASDETKSQNPEDYGVLAFQPATMWPGVNDLTEIKKRIAVAGMYNASVQATVEKLSADTARIEALKSLVGQLETYSVNELTNSLETFGNEVAI
jgi:hypothetical protein